MTERAPVTFDKGRDLPNAGEVLEDWFRQSAGLPDVEVSGLTYPSGAGLSNETILFQAQLEGESSPKEDFVLRVSPPQAKRLCRDTLFDEQVELLQYLWREKLVRVPNIRWVEKDDRWFDRPFFIMDRAVGRVPISEPIYNSEGWLFDAPVAHRRKVWESAMDQLIAINRVPADAVRFVPGGSGDDGPSFHRTLDTIREEYAWASEGGPHPIVDRMWDWLNDNLPPPPPDGLSWGDARVGNILFDDNGDVAAVLDWELVSLGGGIMDLGWWLLFDAVHSEDHPRLEGLGNREETIERWEKGTGLSADDVLWFEILAAVRLSTLIIRSTNLYKVKGKDWHPYTRVAYRRLGWSDPET